MAANAVPPIAEPKPRARRTAAGIRQHPRHDIGALVVVPHNISNPRRLIIDRHEGMTRCRVFETPETSRHFNFDRLAEAGLVIAGPSGRTLVVTAVDGTDLYDKLHRYHELRE